MRCDAVGEMMRENNRKTGKTKETTPDEGETVRICLRQCSVRRTSRITGMTEIPRFAWFANPFGGPNSVRHSGESATHVLLYRTRELVYLIQYVRYIHFISVSEPLVVRADALRHTSVPSLAD
jgi:hypothetical protein